MPEARDDWADWLDRHGPALVLSPGLGADTGRRRDVSGGVRPVLQAVPVASRPDPHLFACVKRCALDWGTPAAGRSGGEAGAARPEGEPLFDGPLEQAERRRRRGRLDTLPEPQREVLVMKVWGG